MSAAAIWDLSQGTPEEPVEPNTIGIAGSLEPRHVIDLHVDCGMDHIIQRDGLAFDKEVELAQSMISDPQRFLREPLSTIFGNSPSEFVDFEVSCGPNDKKKDILLQFETFLAGLRGARAIREAALLIADELYTNGVKNGTPIQGNVNAGKIRQDWVRFVARADNDRLVLGCIDSYGALDITMMTKRIQTCFANGVAQSINQNQNAGAGIGSFMVFNAVASLYIAVECKRQTIVLCAMPLGKRLKETVDLPKNLHTLTCR